MKLLYKIPVPAIIFLLCIATRVPLLADPALMLDGDECVVALMAKHAYLGKELPLYFWGQNYGFSLIEVLFILPFYAVMGINTMAVKLAMLSLWGLGVVFLYKAMLQINNRHKVLALLFALIIILCPAWVNWSMKARGGYLTSFALSSLALYLLFYKGRINEYVRYAGLGLLLCVVYESQPFLLAGLLPLLLFIIVERGSWRSALVCMVTGVGVWALLLLAKSGVTEVYGIHPPAMTMDVIKAGISRFPEYVYNSLQGNYLFAWYQDTNSYYTSFAKIFTGLIFSVGLLGLLHLLFNRKGFGLFIAATLFIPLVLAYSLLTETMEGRYMLPLTGYTLLAVYIYMNRLNLSVPVHLGATYLVIAAAITTLMYPVRTQTMYHRQGLEESLDYLEEQNIRYVYATDCMLPWEVMFYSDEKILSRMFYFPGRYPVYDTMVDKALYAGKKTAVIGYWRAYAGLELDTIDRETQYFISTNPTKEVLEKAFQFPLGE